jgi:hypothetical protein
MTPKFKLSRFRAPLLVALALAFIGCDGPERLSPTDSDNQLDAVSVADLAFAAATPSLANSSRRGIPFGLFDVPNDEYGSTYTGSLLYSYPEYLLKNLEAARKAGAKVIVAFVGKDSYYKDKNGFNFAKWKLRVDRYRGVNFSSYVADGTILGHYILDEPYDASNWNGNLVSRQMVDEMAKYSKQLWPSMATIVRSNADYLKGYRYRYLDAAWAQYSERMGNASAYIQRSVRDARETGLGLVVGMNVLDGGTSASGIKGTKSGKYSMSASQLKSFGTALLNDDYPCAFVSWTYSKAYVSRGDIKSALSDLSGKARERTTKSCRADGQLSTTPDEEPSTDQPPVEEPPTEQPEEEPDDVEPNPRPETPSSIVLAVRARLEKKKHYMTLTWTGASGSKVDVYRNGAMHTTTQNDRKYTNVRTARGSATYTYKLCERGTSRCSNTATATFGDR